MRLRGVRLGTLCKFQSPLSQRFYVRGKVYLIRSSSGAAETRRPSDR